VAGSRSRSTGWPATRSAASCGKAVGYLFRAASKAIRQSAHLRAADLLRQGLQALQHLPETTSRMRLELDYQKALGVTMMAAKGWGAQEVADAYARARQICEHLGDERELFTALRGAGQFHMIRGELVTARALGNRCTVLAAGGSDNGVALETHHLFWSNSFFMGDYMGAHDHAERGMAMYDPARDHELTYLYSGHDPGVCCRCFSGLVLWQQGYADQALARCRDALRLAEQLGHPLTLALAYWALSYVHLLRREPALAQAWAVKEIAICEAYLLPLLLSQGLFQLGWAMAELGALEEGLGKMRDGLSAIRATGAEMGLPFFMGLFGEAWAKAGDVEAGLGEIEQVLATSATTGARFQLPELLRLKGELLVAREPIAAEASFEKAVAAARAQAARLPELRALVSLARCCGERDRHATTRRLAAAYDWFSEGLDTFDLSNARALLKA
jgi:predicted ATPase